MSACFISFVGNMSLYSSRIGMSRDREVIMFCTESVLSFLSAMPFRLLVIATSRSDNTVMAYFEKNPETGIGNRIFRALRNEYVNHWFYPCCNLDQNVS